MKTDTQIAELAYDATKHHTNVPFAQIRNPALRQELIQEVKLADAGRPDGRGLPYHNEVARLVAERNVERETLAREDAKPIVAVPVQPAEPHTLAESLFGPGVPPATVDAGVFLNADAPNLPHVDTEGNPVPTPISHEVHAVEDAAIKANAELPKAAEDAK